ncbi:MAG: glycosyltransferase family 4 protein [Flavobacteriaceae bacterium]
MTSTIAIVLKGYPRLSETFIAQEIRGLEKAGLKLRLFSMRFPTDKARHPVHGEIEAPVVYLPEYLYREPLRVWRGWRRARRLPGYRAARDAFLRDWRRDPTPNRGRRFGQALVLAAELPGDVKALHAHFIHTPASVTRYAATMLAMGWTCSAHAKDIWTSPDWELSEKLGDAGWTVTCTASGHAHLERLAGGRSPVHLSYHGLDLKRFPPFPERVHARDGGDRADPVRIVSVGRAVEKKGYDTLLDALALLPEAVAWRFTHIGGGDGLKALKARAERLGIAGRCDFLGARPQEDVLRLYRDCDIFALACRIAGDGDRDGLPNVLVEAASQRLACVATDVSGIPEFFPDGENGLLTAPDDPPAFAAALNRAITDPALRDRLGRAADERVRRDFDHATSVDFLAGLLGPHSKAAE